MYNYPDIYNNEDVKCHAEFHLPQKSDVGVGNDISSELNVFQDTNVFAIPVDKNIKKQYPIHKLDSTVCTTQCIEVQPNRSANKQFITTILLLLCAEQPVWIQKSGMLQFPSQNLI